MILCCFPTTDRHKWATVTNAYNARCTPTTTTIILWPFVQNYPGEPVPEETFTHPPSWPSSNLYQLLPSTTIHSILPAQTACLAIFLHNLSPHPIWSTSWSGVLHLIFHTFLHPIRCIPNSCVNVMLLSLMQILEQIIGVYMCTHEREFHSFLC